MITIKTPEIYINEPDVLKNAGEHIAKVGKTALIVGGKTALSIAGEELLKSLESSGVTFEVKEFHGYPSDSNVEAYAPIVTELGADFIIGVGGGKTLDFVKILGETTDLPVVTVPTIAATCAAWSALTIVYDDTGKFARNVILKRSPKLVLADTKILAAAPIRYLKAGIADTIVKWYESAPHAAKGRPHIALRTDLQTSKLALEILKSSSLEAIEESKNNNTTEIFKDVVDSVIMLAGLAGSIRGGARRTAIGHAIHNSFTGIHDTHESLHGEKVIFGVLAQLVLEGKPEEEINHFIQFLNELDLPITLEQLGIKEDVANKVSAVAKGVNLRKEGITNITFEVGSSFIEQAILRADQLGRESLDRTEVATS